MTILQSLVAFYDRLERRGEIIPKPGYAPVRIGFLLELSGDGQPIALIDKRDHSGRKPVAPALLMPEVSRTSGIKPAFLWDKTSYALGLTTIEVQDSDGKQTIPGQGKRTTEEHEAFKAEHLEALRGNSDPGLIALSRFLEAWTPDQWEASPFRNDEALDEQIAFCLKGDLQRIDERPAARALLEERSQPPDSQQLCMISGTIGAARKYHPQFKGVMGAQSSGATIVSFNADAFESYDKKKGTNAPVSDEAAFKYGAALNWLLVRGNARSFRLGETTVVFWADERPGPDGEAESMAVEQVMWSELGQGEPEGGAEGADDNSGWQSDTEDPDRDLDAEDAVRIRGEMANVAALRTAPDISKLQADTRVHVLGLSPNSGRIAVRFYLVDTFGHLEANLIRHKCDMEIAPAPANPNQKAYALLYETAIQHKAENIPPRLGGELAKAILTGGSYPRTLLSAVVGRIRADKAINPTRVALCKAIIKRNLGEEDFPVALDPENTNPAYRLGRLFALIEGAQKAALPKLNATVKDRFFGAACATPARVFPLLHKNAMNHIAAVRKERGGGLAHWLECEIGQIWSGLSDDLPRALRLEEQGRFIAGYYHQRFSKRSETPTEAQNILSSDTEGEAQ